MTESRIEATDRLRREGRWAAASKFRDDKRREFRAAGQKRAAANDAAWEAMLAEYPPPAPASPTPTDYSETIAAILTIKRDPDDESTELDDVFWVYDRLGSDDIAPADFPGLGAWSLWIWARNNRARSYEMLWRNAEAANAMWGDLSCDGEVPAPKLSREETCWLWRERLANGFQFAMGEVTRHAFWVLDLASDEPAPISQVHERKLTEMVCQLSQALITRQLEF
jgi:hypothetical protein